MSKAILNLQKQEVEKIRDFLISSFFGCVAKEKLIPNKELVQIHKLSIVIKDFELVSIAMSYLALNGYKQGARYYQTLTLLSDANHLANSSKSKLAQKINLYCSSLVEYYEKNYKASLNLIKSSLKIEAEDSSFDYFIEELKTKVEKEIEKLPQSSILNLNDDHNEALIALMQVGRTIALETNIDNLLDIISKQIKQALEADRCTVFLLDDEKKELWSKVAQGLEEEEIRFSIDKGLAGHVAQSGETINIKNAYESEYFNKEIDNKTGYKTKNILCMPIRNLSHQIIGVFQVLNKLDGDFTQKDEDLLIAIGSSAGIALENANLFSKQKKMIEEQKELFSNFIDTLSTSIDARDKITSGHSKRVTLYAELICNICNLTDSQKEIIKNASLLHDIGKIGIKDSILQKEGRLTQNEYEHIKDHVKHTHNILSKIYKSKDFKEVTKIASSHHEKFDGTGYFKGLKGQEIPLGGRILALCDVFDAITSKRHYREKMNIKEVLKIITDGKNKHFDANLVDMFFKIPCYDILNIMQQGVNCDDKMDEILLKEFNLDDLYAILNNERNVITNREKRIIKVFDKYYYKQA